MPITKQKEKSLRSKLKYFIKEIQADEPERQEWLKWLEGNIQPLTTQLVKNQINILNSNIVIMESLSELLGRK